MCGNTSKVYESSYPATQPQQKCIYAVAVLLLCMTVYYSSGYSVQCQMLTCLQGENAFLEQWLLVCTHVHSLNQKNRLSILRVNVKNRLSILRVNVKNRFSILRVNPLSTDGHYSGHLAKLSLFFLLQNWQI